MKPKPDISMTRKALYFIVAVLLLIVTLELLAFVTLRATTDGFSLSGSRRFRSRILDKEDTEVFNRPSSIVLHPYLGFVYTPEDNNEERTAHHGGLPITEYGFLDDGPPLRVAEEDTVVIGIFGGSVAYEFSVHGTKSLVEQLAASEFFRGKEFSFVRVALGGYKQPQQILALTYLLTLGAHFDIVINLDGFNEATLPLINNVSNNVAPYFPRNWHWLAARTLSHEAKASIGELTRLRSGRTRYAATFNAPIIRASYLANLIWHTLDDGLSEQIAAEQNVLTATRESRAKEFEVTGPPYDSNSVPGLFKDLAAYWKESSIQMNRICRANGIEYWHFLQPNQYLPESKNLSHEEHQIAYKENSPFKRAVESGYPLFRLSGEELAETGIRFHDMTQVFKGVGETLYQDDCCHMNVTGQAILGEAIGARMVRDLQGWQQ